MTAHSAYKLAKEWGKDKTLFIVTADEKSARTFKSDLEFFSAPLSKGEVCQFEAPDALPYTHLSTSLDIWISRLKVLYKLYRHEPIAVVASAPALLRRTPPHWIFSKYTRTIRRHELLARAEFLKQLQEAGYINQPLVEDEGAFAVRGGIIDVFSPILDRPARIELDGDEIISIRLFDPVTQRSSISISQLTVIPAGNVIINEETKAQLFSKLKDLCDISDIKPTERREFAEAIEHGFYPQSAETLMPLFYEKTASIIDYLPADALIYINDEIEVKAEAEKLLQRLASARAEAKHIEKIVRVEELYDDAGKIPPTPPFFKGGEGGLHHASCFLLPASSREGNLKQTITHLRHWQKLGLCRIITCHTSTQADRLIDILRYHGFDAKIPPVPPLIKGGIIDGFPISIILGSLSGGFISEEDGFAILTDEEIFGSKVQRKTVVTKPIQAFTDFSEIHKDNLIVHKKHGIGRYMGLKNLDVGGAKNDFLLLQYLGGDKLYLPTWKIDLISRYIGSAETVALDRLGGKRWSETQKKVTAAIRTMALELLKIYAARKVEKGFSFSARDELLEEFEAAFPYDETVDQWQAIEDVLKDMRDDRPADRLICGDVGYGKTEVALRAAFKAISDKKQVAVLVPTTILAFQHYENFIERFSKWPVRIEMLSRFRSRTEQKHVADELARGMVNIVIGTHRLLQKDIRFHDLGLLVIDEEHRFGVAHKERIKKIKSSVDTISMSATPIPRTLHMSFSGIREISVINTPPANRLAIRTYISEFDDTLIRSAVIAELSRGGQVYFVHNRVESVERMHEHLSKLIPEAKIAVAHGQMKEGELEDIMMKFLQRRADVLLCTTIIESGLDIPSANTIIINRADRMGLAELYQLRGRVGRSNVQAYAYLLTPAGNNDVAQDFSPANLGRSKDLRYDVGITSTAQKRLALLQRYTELGSGFQIAMHDLEIRGAGNLLGARQSGHINAIGYEMYAELLEKTINRMQGKPEKPEIDTEISLPIEAFIPVNYVEDESERLALYRRLAGAASHDALDLIADEITDRFGKPPDHVKNLFDIIEIKILAKQIAAETIQFNKGRIFLKFRDGTKANIEADKNEILNVTKKLLRQLKRSK